MKSPLYRLGLMALLALVTGCSSDERAVQQQEEHRGPSVVYAGNYPLAYFAGRIAGDSVEVVLPVPVDIDPAMWVPDAGAIAELQRADLVLLNGAGYEGWLQRVTLSRSRLVDTSTAFVDRLIPVENDVTHSHGPTGDHSHAGTAFTTWLDCEFAIEHARAVLSALVRLWPENEGEYRARFADLERELLELDQALGEVSARIGDQPLLFSHPVYQYLERRYSLKGLSLHWEPGQMPEEAQWRELSGMLSSHPAAWMIWEGTPHPEAAGRLEGLGVQSVVYRPAGNKPASGDYMSVMQDNLRALQEAFPNSAE